MTAAGIIIQVSKILEAGQNGIADDAVTQLKRMSAAGVMIAFVDQIPQAELEATCRRLCADAELDSFPCVGLGEKETFIWPKPAQLLRAAVVSEMDIFTSWVCAHDEKAFHAAAQAGFLGGIYIGSDEQKPKSNCGLQVLNHALSLADAPRVMIPPDGGCWHDKR